MFLLFFYFLVFFFIILKVAPRLKEIMTRRGSLMIGYQPLRQKPNFFRFVVQNSGLDINDVNYVLEELERMGQNL